MEQKHVKHGRNPKSHMSRNFKYSTMKKTVLVMVIAAIMLMISCKNGALKITNANDLIKEFKENPTSALAKYKGQTVEFVGTFDVNIDEDAPLFLVDSGWRVNKSVRVFINYNKDSLKRKKIFPYLHETYFYNENTQEIYTDEKMNEIAMSVLTHTDRTTNRSNEIYDILSGAEISIKSAINCKYYPIDTLAYVKTKELKVDANNSGFFYPFDTVIASDPDVKANKIHRCDSAYENVIDKVTLNGKIKDIKFTKTNAGDDVMVIQLENPEITNKERVFDFNTLPVLDYISAKKAVQEKLISVSSISPNWIYYKVNDPNGADLMIGGGYNSKVVRKVSPSERFEIVGDNVTYWSVIFENGTTGNIEKTKVIKFE